MEEEATVAARVGARVEEWAVATVVVAMAAATAVAMVGRRWR